VQELIRRARLRLLNLELMSQGSYAFCAALVAVIVLLLLGTQILNWYWAALIPLAAVGAGLYRAFQRRPSAYRTAQIVDHRLTLADTLSTAVYFSGRPSDEPDAEDVMRSQRESAERAAASADLRRAIPYRMPRSAYVVAALALVASSLFALRYVLSKRLDLRAPMARMIQDQFSPADRKETAENTRRTPPPLDNADDSADAPSVDQDQKGQNQPDANPDSPGQQGDQQNAEKSGASKDDGKKSGDPQDQDGQAQSQQADDRDQQDSGQSSSASQGENKSDQNKQADGKQNSNNASESGSLMSKIKDFAENLLSKMKPQQQNNSTPPQQAANQNSKQGSGQQNGKQQSKDGQKGDSQQADGQQGENGDNQKDGQDSQGKGSGQDKSQQATKQPGSGVGSEDGNKEIRQAEQLAAMGKISELIGKRSAAVTGEATVEVQSTSQQLHTAYVQRGAEHSQAGAEINRDEIPVALQPYVQQYFDQLRKQPAAAVKKQ
jgi:hypothetical protein